MRDDTGSLFQNFQFKTYYVFSPIKEKKATRDTFPLLVMIVVIFSGHL